MARETPIGPRRGKGAGGGERTPRKGKPLWRRLLTLIEYSVYLATAVLVLGAAALLGVIVAVQGDLPTLEPLEAYGESSKWGQTTRVYAADGSEIGEFYEEDRVIIPYASIPDSVVRAMIAVEDERYDPAHRLYWTRRYGIDPIGIARSMVVNLRSMRFAQGGSTLTQQLAKKLFLTDEKSLRRKLQELVLAYRIERRFTREEILERYFNKVFFGNGAYGIHAAASRYFEIDLATAEGKESLTVGQAALLAGLVRKPSDYNPLRNPDKARNRTKIVLSRMVEVGYLTPEEAQRADSDLWENYRPRGGSDTEADGGGSRSASAQWYVEQVRRELLEKGWTADQIYRGGFRIYTTCDPKIQQSANEAVRKGLDRLRGEIRRWQGDSANDLQAGLVALDPATGSILAMVGGYEWGRENMFNRAVQGRGRQAGSAFKPFVYLAALESGTAPEDPNLPGAEGPVTAATAVRDEAFSVPNPGGPAWTPHNYDGSQHGPVSVRIALRRSLNVATVRLLLTAGAERVLERAGSLGIPTNDMQPYPSLALGVFDVRPIDMARAYAAFANGGYRVEPHAIQEITDAEGRVLFREGPPLKQEVMSPQVAYLMTSLLKDVVDHGTAAGAVGAVVGRPAAGKTGTTDDYSDAWFVGFTPDLSASVWVGFDRRRTMGRGMTGAHAGGTIWADFVKHALAGRPARAFVEPRDMEHATFCALSGLLVTPDCPAVTEAVLPDRVPTAHCPLHIGGDSMPIAAFLGNFAARDTEIEEARDDGVPPLAPAREPVAPAPSGHTVDFPGPPGEPR